MFFGDFPAYVSVRDRRARAARHAATLTKKGRKLVPAVVDGKKIATSYWGSAWCDNLESYSDYASRLPRGRSYVKNGLVIDLQIGAGRVDALVVGTSPYEVVVRIAPLQRARWKALVKQCAGQIGSLVELLQGRFDRAVMEILARPRTGLFPSPNEIELECSCPDWAGLCKHVAGALYGVGARLDRDPSLFFTLRQVDQAELVAEASTAGSLVAPAKKKKKLAASSLSGLFGIDLDEAEESPRRKPKASRAKKGTIQSARRGASKSRNIAV